MSRSRKKHPFDGVTSAPSDKEDKRRAHRKLRRAIQQLGLSNPDDLVVPILREVSNVWGFNKDGKYRFDPREHPELMRK